MPTNKRNSKALVVATPDPEKKNDITPIVPRCVIYVLAETAENPRNGQMEVNEVASVAARLINVQSFYCRWSRKKRE
jgi:hypothetical protein